MPNNTTSSVVIFREGAGYLLVQALTHGWKGNIYLVKSLADGKLYVRKKLSRDAVNLVPYNDIRWSNILPPTYAPAVIETKEYGLVADAIFFTFCNGGDLRQLVEKYTARREVVPEDFIWYYLIRAISVFGLLHYGWTDFQTPLDPDWRTVIHRDAWSANYFLHWPSSDPLTNSPVFPDILLGDWGTAQYVDEDLRQPTTIGNDIFGLIWTLFCLLIGDELPRSVKQEEILGLLPAQYSLELKSVALQLSSVLVGRGRTVDQRRPYPDTMDLVKNLIPLAESMLRRFNEQNGLSDISWTKPVANDRPALFKDDAALVQWCKEHNNGEDLMGDWSLFPVNKHTFDMLRRSERLNPEMYKTGSF